MAKFNIKNIGQAMISILLLVAILGPWWFDRINVPAQYTCNRPFVRLEGDFCGMPMSGIWIPVFVGARFVELAKEISYGEIAFSTSISMILQACLLLLMVVFMFLPIISPWLVIVKGSRKTLHWLEMASLGVAACIGGIWVSGVMNPVRSIALWGAWLYISVAVIAFVLEVFILVFGKMVGRVQPLKANDIH